MITRGQKIWLSIILINLINIYICLFESVASPFLLSVWALVLFDGTVLAGWILTDFEQKEIKMKLPYKEFFNIYKILCKYPNDWNIYSDHSKIYHKKSDISIKLYRKILFSDVELLHYENSSQCISKFETSIIQNFIFRYKIIKIIKKNKSYDEKIKTCKLNQEIKKMKINYASDSEEKQKNGKQ